MSQTCTVAQEPCSARRTPKTPSLCQLNAVVTVRVATSHYEKVTAAAAHTSALVSRPNRPKRGVVVRMWLAAPSLQATLAGQAGVEGGKRSCPSCSHTCPAIAPPDCPFRGRHGARSAPFSSFFHHVSSSLGFRISPPGRPLTPHSSPLTPPLSPGPANTGNEVHAALASLRPALAALASLRPALAAAPQPLSPLPPAGPHHAHATRTRRGS